MQRYDKDSSLQELRFDKASFLVQLHDIPLRYMTMEAAEKIGDVIGEVTRPAEAKDADGGNFLRVNVAIDLFLPLCRGRLITLENDKQIWVRLRYERLPNLCYWCGRLTHADKDCELGIESERTLRPKQRQIGPSIRAPVFVPSRKNVISVPGFYKAMKKTSHVNANVSMDCDSAVQVTVNQGETEATADPNRKEGSDPIGWIAQSQIIMSGRMFLPT